MATGALDLKTIQKMQKETQFRERIRKIRYSIFLLIAFSFAVFIAIAVLAVLNEGLSAFVGSILRIDWWYFGAALLAVFASYAIRFPKWQMYLNKLKVRLNLKTSFMIYMSMYSMDITPGRWGRAIVSYTINRLTNVRFAVTFPAVVADIFTDFLGFAFITDAMAIIVGKFVLLAFFITSLLMVPFFFVYVQRPFNWVKKKFIRVRKRFRFLRRLNLIFSTATLYFRHNKKLRGSAFVYSMLLTIPSMFLNGMALYVVMLAFGVPLTVANIPEVIFIFSFSLVLGMVTGIPGTLGVTDAALISQMQYFFPGVMTFGLASAITIFFRAASVWFVQGFGFAAFLYTTRYWKG